MGAHLNVKINSKDVEDRAWMDDVLTRGAQIQDKAVALEREILGIVEKKL